MLRAFVLSLVVAASAAPALADDTAKPQPQPQAETKTLSGMSILGNDEAPTSLVIVPWKGSELSAKVGLSNLLNAGTQAVDRDVFLRELSYYDLRSKE